MTPQEIQAEIIKKEAELAAIQLQGLAVSTAGALTGLYLANKNKVKWYGYVGYFLAGSMIAGLPLDALRAKSTAALIADIKNLKAMLPAPAPQQSLMEYAQSQIKYL